MLGKAKKHAEPVAQLEKELEPEDKKQQACEEIRLQELSQREPIDSQDKVCNPTKKPRGSPKLRRRILAGALAVLLILSASLTDGTIFEIRRKRTEAQQTATGYLDKQPVESEEVNIQKAYKAISDGDNETALRQVSACLEVLPEGSALHEDLLMKQGCLMALEEDYKNARPVFDRVNELYPKNSQAWLLSAQLQLQDGDMIPAMNSMKKFLSMEQGSAEQISVTAQLCYSAGKYEDTLSYGEMALKLGDKKDGELLKCMGMSSLLLNKLDDAEQYLSQSIARVDSKGEIYYYRGVCNMALEELEQAEKDFTAAIENGYNGAACYYNRGICLVALEQWDGVRADMQKVAELDEDEELTAIAKDILTQLDGMSDAVT